MTTLSYNVNEQTACCLSYSDGIITDISLVRLGEVSNRDEVIERATKSLKSLQSRNKDSSYVFRYPPILKGDRQEDMISRICNRNSEDKFVRTPFSLNGALAGMYSKGNVNPPEFKENSESVILYTDASVVESRDPSISACVLNSDLEIISLINCSIPSTRNVSEAEALAGLLGLETVNSLDRSFEKFSWYCDNNTVLRFVQGENEDKLKDSAGADELKKKFLEYNVEPERIKGSRNILADRMAKDIRHEEVDNSIIFRSSSIDDELPRSDLDRLITKIRTLN